MQAALPHHWSSHAGVEFALWDLKGKALSMPVYELLGGKVREGVDLMGFVHHDTPERMVDHARTALDEHGYPVLKMKIGLDPKEDVKRYEAVAEAVGDKAVIQVDGNVGYTIDQALPALAAMEEIGALGAVEQPVERLEDMAEIARRPSPVRPTSQTRPMSPLRACSRRPDPALQSIFLSSSTYPTPSLDLTSH